MRVPYKLYEKPIIMPDGGKYYIDESSPIGAGGYSLIYSAHSANKENKNRFVIKEFFPFKGAKRNEEGVVIPANESDKELFNEKLKSFNNEGIHGVEAGNISCQVINFLSNGNGYALMKHVSSDTYTLLELVKCWKKRSPQSSVMEYCDLGRVKYSLLIIRSLLSLLKALHGKGILHLDISPGNVFWGGQEIVTGEGNIAFLADFGCAVKADENNQYSYSGRISHYNGGFSAPELVKKDVSVSNKTDLFSCAALLLFLCLDDEVTDFSLDDPEWKMESYCTMFGYEEIIRRKCNKLSIPNEIKNKLANLIICGCQEEPENRYQTAERMQEDVTSLLEMVRESKHPHIYLSEVKPISTSYVRHSEDLLRQIEEALNKEKTCFIHGMSGVGKSELMRQYAEEKLKHLPVLEIYFPEENVDYTMEQVVSSVTYLNLKDKDSLEEKKNILYNFLEKEVVLLIHNFNKLDMSFLQENFKRKNVKLLVSTQSTKEELETENVPDECMLELTTNVDFGVKIFKKVFEQHHRNLPGTEEEIAKLSNLLFDLPILVNLVAAQLTKKREDRFFVLLKELQKTSVDRVLKETTRYKKDYLQERMEGNPFEIVSKIILSMLPSLNTIEEQCLQVISIMPGEWISSEELEQIIGDLPNKEGFDLAYDAITNLIDARLLQTKNYNNKRYISMHALMARIVCSDVIEKPYIKEATLEFWQHLEKNAFVLEAFINYEKNFNKNSFLKNSVDDWEDATDHWQLNNWAFQSLKTLLYIKYWCISQNLISELDDWSESYGYQTYIVEIPELNGLREIIKTTANRAFINSTHYINLEVDSNLTFEKVIVYYKTGAVLMKQCRNDFCDKNRFMICIDASCQLTNRYYSDRKEIEYCNVWKGSFCTVDVYHDMLFYKGQVDLPDTFCGMPVTQIIYRDSFISLTADPYKLKVGRNCFFLGGETYHANSIELNKGISSLDIRCNELSEWTLPESIENITDRCLGSQIKKVRISQNSNYFIDIEGIIYTKDMRKIVFITPEKRLLSTAISEDVKDINLDGIGGRKGFSLFDLPFYELEWLLARRGNLSTFEKKLYTIVNEKEIENIFSTIINILNFYYGYIKNENIPFYFGFFHSYNSLHPFDMDTNKKTLISVTDAVTFMERMCCFRTIENRKIVIKSSSEFIKNNDYSNFKEIYQIFLQEDIRCINLVQLLKKKIFLYDSKVIAKGLEIIKEKKQCKTLNQLLVSSKDTDLIFEEIIDVCDSIMI